MSYIGLLCVLIGAVVLFFDNYRDERSFNGAYQDLRADISSIMSSQMKAKVDLDSELQVLRSKIEKGEKRLAEIEHDTQAAQDHMAQIRKQQLKFKNTIYPRQINPKLKASESPISVQLIEKKKR